MAKLTLYLDKCVTNHTEGREDICCPYADSVRTRGAGYALDYFCTLMLDPKSECGFKVTSGYVEWERDINPIPIWCPLRSPEDVMLEILEK